MPPKLTDPMDSPPVDHGSDRYDYVEIEAPRAVNPFGKWWDTLIAEPCPDCRANVFAKWIGPAPEDASFDLVGDVVKRENWSISIAHDATCPILPSRTTPPGRYRHRR